MIAKGLFNPQPLTGESVQSMLRWMPEIVLLMGWRELELLEKLQFINVQGIR